MEMTNVFWDDFKQGVWGDSWKRRHLGCILELRLWQAKSRATGWFRIAYVMVQLCACVLGLRVDQEGWSSGMWKGAGEGKSRKRGRDRLLCARSGASVSHSLCPLPGSSVHGILQARRRECAALSNSWDQAHFSCTSCIGKWILYHFATWEAPWVPC